MKRIVNARITSTMLGYEDHGILSCMIHVEWDGAGVGIGGYVMDTPQTPPGTGRIGTAFGTSLIMAVLDVVGVSKWEDLPGQYVRVEDNGLGSRCTRIGNLMSEKWLDLEGFAAKFKESNQCK